MIGGVVSASPRNSASVILYFDSARILNYAELFTLGIRCLFRRNSILLISEIFASAVIALIDECKYRVTLQLRLERSTFTTEIFMHGYNYVYIYIIQKYKHINNFRFILMITERSYEKR